MGHLTSVSIIGSGGGGADPLTLEIGQPIDRKERLGADSADNSLSLEYRMQYFNIGRGSGDNGQLIVHTIQVELANRGRKPLLYQEAS